MINIIKSAAPSEVNYKDKEQRKQIKQDFFEICYLCERHEPIDFEIDHFSPQKHFPAKVNNWDNLYYICQKCNKIKPKDTNQNSTTEILDCCKDNVENIIQLYYNDTQKTVDIEINTSDPTLLIKSENTRKILDKVYNGIGCESDFPENLIKEITKRLAIFIAEVQKYKTTKLKKGYVENIRKHLRKDTFSELSSFTTLKKGYLRKIDFSINNLL